ncbi:hypothetical protein EDD18DRAFT_340809 [Armillaria luteobubalina]|uniref:Uncharacterized protein n=1 Tax=Armillaria luteobubalina TaxID=153913 RepID=A0AA39QMD7_9AGAR|nr:hypothetical protein EDD18DRAFT_340809 [Armillaria luteobubalina]
MTHSKSRPAPRNSNTISSSSSLGPLPPYSEDIERGVSETSPLYRANPARYTVPRGTTEIEHQLILDGLTWTELAPSIQCLRYNTREYSALLKGVSNDMDSLEWCKEKEITVHGIHFRKPAYCTIDVDRSGIARVHGHWIVESNEPRCMTSWEDFRDKGCAGNGSHYRRIEAHLGNHQPLWDNWREMCATTPMDYEGYHFDRPDSCDLSFFGGVTGVWFLKDKSC